MQITISVNIPLIVDGDAKIVLDALKKIDYPRELYEIIVIEGNHIASQRNIGFKHSQGEIVYLLDDDSQVQPNAFQIIAQEFADPQVAAVGGPSLTPSNRGSRIGQWIGYALETAFGALRMRYRYGRKWGRQGGSEYRLHGANLALRKSVINKLGGIDETIVPNEETDLLRRIQDKGNKLVYNPQLYVYRQQRQTIKDLLKQFCHYGQGRMKQIFKNPQPSDLIFLIPVGFLIYLLTLPIAIFGFAYHQLYWYWFLSVYLLPLFLYGFVSVLTTVKAALKYHRWDLLFGLPFIFPFIHLAYAWGLIKHLLRSSNLKDTVQNLYAAAYPICTRKNNEK